MKRDKDLPAKVLITLATLFYGVVPVIADLSDSHSFNPNWMPHAKLHLAWLLSTNSLLAIFSLYILWMKDRTLEAGLIGIIVMAGFWVSALTKNLYGGAFVDPHLEVPEIIGLHPNVFAFIFISLFLLVGTFLQARSKRA